MAAVKKIVAEWEKLAAKLEETRAQAYDPMDDEDAAQRDLLEMHASVLKRCARQIRDCVE